MSKSLSWLEREVKDSNDPYLVALAALAHAASSDKESKGRARSLAARLATLGTDGVWTTSKRTWLGASGHSAQVETTALALQAFADAGLERRDLLDDGRFALERLRGKRHNTQASIQALRASLVAAPAATPHPVSIAIREFGADRKFFVYDPNATEPLRVAVGVRNPYNIELATDSDAPILGTVTRTTYEDWTSVPTGPFRLRVDYPSATWKVGEQRFVKATVRNTTNATLAQVTVEIGIPPGCDVDTKRAHAPHAKHVEKRARTVVFYLADLPPGGEAAFRIPITPRYPIEVATAPSRAFEYYTPDHVSYAQPVRVRAR